MFSLLIFNYGKSQEIGNSGFCPSGFFTATLSNSQSKSNVICTFGCIPTKLF